MSRFTHSLRNWGSDSFAQTLKDEIECLQKGELPLEQGTSQGGHVDDSNISATILSIVDGDELIQAKVGVFFDEIVGGCSCGDEPITENAYCEIQVSIDKKTAEAEFAVIPE